MIHCILESKHRDLSKEYMQEMKYLIKSQWIDS